MLRALQFSFLLVICPGLEVPGQMVTVCLTLGGNARLLPKAAIPFDMTLPRAEYEGSNFSTLPSVVIGLFDS